MRAGLGLTQEEFGRRFGYSQDAVAKWEGGQVPHALVLREIAATAARPTTVDWLVAARAKDSEALTPDERFLLKCFRDLDKRRPELARDLLSLFSDLAEERKSRRYQKR